MYNKYAILAPSAYDALKSYFLNSDNKVGDDVDPLEKGTLLTLDQFIEFPIRHLEKYNKVLTQTIEIVVRGIENEKEYTIDLMKMIASVQVEMSHFEVKVLDHYRIHSKRSYSVSLINIFKGTKKLYF